MRPLPIIGKLCVVSVQIPKTIETFGTIFQSSHKISILKNMSDFYNSITRKTVAIYNFFHSSNFCIEKDDIFDILKRNQAKWLKTWKG